jgi:hypothetical protein
MGGVRNDDPNSNDDFDIPFHKKTIVCLKKILNKRIHSFRLILKMKLAKTILVQMMILNNLAHSILMIKNIKILINMCFYPLNFPLGLKTFYFTLIIHRNIFKLLLHV